MPPFAVAKEPWEALTYELTWREADCSLGKANTFSDFLQETDAVTFWPAPSKSDAL
jgi:hypothetical protein